MLRVLIGMRGFATTTSFKVDLFSTNDYRTICRLLKQKFPIYNENMKVYSDIRLLDDKSKLIGIYSPAQARKKALNLKRDIVLVKADAKPPVCKLSDFRQSTLSAFFTQIILQRNQQLINRASKIKNLKLKITLNEDQLRIKGKQISELAKKHSKVRVYMVCKEEMMDAALSKLQFLKSQLQNSCKVLEEVNFNEQYQEEGENENQRNSRTVSLVLKSTQNEFVHLLEESSKHSPEEAISYFLKRYYKQQDVQMKDLKNQADEFSIDVISDLINSINPPVQDHKSSKKQKEDNKLVPKGIKRVLDFPKEQTYQYQLNKQLEEIAVTKIVNDRLKRIMTLSEQL